MEFWREVNENVNKKQSKRIEIIYLNKSGSENGVNGGSSWYSGVV